MPFFQFKWVMASGGFKGGGGRPLSLIDRMHLKTRDNFASKYMIFE